MSVEIRIWQLVTATALVALAAGVLIGHSFTGGGAPKSDSAKAGSTDTEALIKTLEGQRFDTVVGAMTMRATSPRCPEA